MSKINKDFFKIDSNHIIAYCGAEQVLSFLPNDEDSNKTNIDSIIVLKCLDAHIIKIICDNLQCRKDDFKNGKNSDVRLNRLEIRISSNIMQRAGYHDLKYTEEKNATHYRNTSILGARILVASEIEDDSNKHVKDQITEKSITDSIVDYIHNYIEAKFDSNVSIISDYLTSVLKALKDEMSLGYVELSEYSAAVLNSVLNSGEASEPAIRSTLGACLYTVLLPVSNTLFSNLSPAKCEEVLVGYINEWQFIGTGVATLLENITHEEIINNYNQNFVTSESVNDQYNTEKVTLAPSEQKIFERYLCCIREKDSEGYKCAYAELCKIDLTDKLSRLFDKQSVKRQKEKLWDRTESYFKEKKIINFETIVEDSKQNGINRIANKTTHNLTSDDIEKIYDFYCTHRSIIDQEKNLRKDWNALIFSNRKYTYSNFLLSLTACIVHNIQPGDDSLKIELKLTNKHQSLLRLNSEAGYYFCLRFGAYLRILQQLLGNKFVLSAVGSKSKYKPEDELKAILNYRDFIEINKDEIEAIKNDKKQKTSEDTLKFELNFNSDSGIFKRQLSWQYSSSFKGLSLEKNLNALINLCSDNAFDIVTGVFKSNGAISFDLKDEESIKLGRNILALIHNLKEANCENPLVLKKVSLIESCLDDFKVLYTKALNAYYYCNLSYIQARELSTKYIHLQLSILDILNEDSFDRCYFNDIKELLSNVLKIGMVYSNDDRNICAIASPFTVESLRSYTAKLERLSYIIKSILSGSLKITERELFIESLKNDIYYCDGPELCIPEKLTDTNKSYLCAFEDNCGYTQYKKISVDQYEPFSYVSIKDYSISLVDFIERHIDTLPLIPDRFVIMLFDCKSPDLAEVFYNNLCANKVLSKTKFSLVLVNKKTSDCESIYNRFELLRHNGSVSSEQLNRVQVSVLTYNNDANAYGTYSRYINSNRFEHDDKSSMRVFDVSVLIHSFDSRSKLDYNAYDVSLVKDDIHIQPSLVNRNDTAIISSDKVGKFLVNQIQTIGRIQYFNSLSLCLPDVNIAMSQEISKNVDLVRDYIEEKNHAYSSLKIYLPYRIVNKSGAIYDNYDEELIGPIHERSETVLFLDELQCRRLLSSESNRLVYYTKLRNQTLNMLVSSSPKTTNVPKFLKSIFEKAGIQQNAIDRLCKHVHKDATLISGGLLTRAENGIKSTYELMGNVMCKFIADQISSYLLEKMNVSQVPAIPAPIFVSLDDYHRQLTGKQSEHADLLCIHVVCDKNHEKDKTENNKYTLCVSVIESKFLDKYQSKSVNQSRDQASQSLENISRACFEEAADRCQLLSKIADIIVDNCKTSSKENDTQFSEIQKMIREEQIDIMFMGYSMIFLLDGASNINDTKWIKASAHEDFDEQKNDDARIIQLVVYPKALSNMFNQYFKIKSERHTDQVTVSDHAMLSEWLEYEEMSDLAAYLDTKRPKLIHIRRKVEEYVPMSLNTQIASLAQDEASAQSEPQGSDAAKAGTKASTASKASKTRSSKTASTKEAAEKPKRGRPRKTATVKEANAASEHQIKPKRGRPRKSDAKDEVEVLTPMPQQQFLSGLDD